MSASKQMVMDKQQEEMELLDQSYWELSEYERKVITLQTIQEQLYRLRNATPSPSNSFKTTILESRERTVERELQALADLSEDYDD